MAGWRRWLPWSAAGGLLAAVVALSEVGFALEEGYGLETLFRLRGAIAPPSDVVVLRLDNDSLSVLRALPDQVGEWPAPLRGCAERHPELVGEVLQIAGIDRLPRRLQACVIELAHAAGAATIVYDIAFPTSPDREAGTAALAAAIAAHGRVVLREATRREHLPGRTQLDIVTSLHPSLAAVAAGIATARLPDATGRIDQFWVRDRASPSPVQLAGRALEVALLDTLDALARRLGRMAPDRGPDARREWLVATALALDAAGERLTAAERAAVAALRRVHHGEAHLYFNFYGPPGTVPSLPLWQLLDGSSAVPLAGATLFVGKANLTTSREPDTFETVMTTADGVRMSGVELWATAFANLRDGTALQALPEWRRIGVTLALGMVLMLAAHRGGVTRSVVLTLTVAAAWLAVAMAAFMLWALWLPFVGLLVLLPAMLLIAELRRFARARRLAAPFMSAAVAHRVFDDVEIPTTWLDATVLLTDVVDFAGRARRLEAQSPDALRAFQDRHIGMLTVAIRAEGGEVLEQTGDGVLALWSGPDHAASACRAALAVAAAVERQNAALPDDEPPLRLRIGINSGPVTVGEIGAAERRFLTCSGDTVNMTQRLEALGKSLCPDAPAAAILLGARTARALGPGFAVELVAHELLRGDIDAQPVHRLWPRAATAQRAVAAAAGLLLVLLPTVATARPACDAPIARLVASAGVVTVDGLPAAPGSGGVPLCADAVIVVGAGARATLLHLAGDTMFQLDANSRVRLGGPPEPDSGLVELTRGALFFISQVRRILTVRTPSADAGIEGTEVLVAVGDGDAPALDLRVYEGRVALRPGPAPPAEPLPAAPLLAGDRLLIAADGGVAVVRGDVASLRLAAARELAWTLYYPPLFPDLAAAPEQLAEASQLLAAGRVEAAQAVLAMVPGDSPQAAGRDALLAVIAVSQGDPTGALALADAAVARQRSAATLLARSYAEQALRRLEEARSSAREATAVEPGDALAWARLAELELVFGDSRAARRAADRSAATGVVPLVHVVQGFARLAAFDARGAEASFATALDADSNQPLAHLGRGLALIRRNDLAEGCRGLEAAAALDPARSLLRSYLGKAYFEENRDRAAADQLRIAKELDPDDPTPWLYSDIQKQLTNRPVEALRDLERSIALNDNRATFRSRLLLDEDRAVRGASLGDVFTDLGFQRLGTLTASRALAVDPTTASAHRLLADSVIGRQRFEIARASELLQAQLLDPLNLNPLQPSAFGSDILLAERSLFPRSSFNEFTSAFESDGLTLRSFGAVGSRDTREGELILSGLSGGTSAAVGAYRQRTDGFRDNNDLEQHVLDAFVQHSPSPELSIQAQARRRTSDFGDLSQTLDGRFDAFRRADIDQTTLRLGGRLAISPAQLFLVSLIGSDRDTDDTFLRDEAPTDINEQALQAELQYLHRAERFTSVVGVRKFHVDRRFEEFETTESDYELLSAYMYHYLHLSSSLDLLGGLDLSSVDDNALPVDDTALLPKLGVSWFIRDWLNLRASILETRKPRLVVSQTLEPTTIAGFNQFFDDINSATATQYGVGVDARLTPSLWAGLEFTHRDIDVPFTFQTDVDVRKRWDDVDEDEFRAYGYLLVTDSIAMNFGFEYSAYRSNTDAPRGVRSLDSIVVPLGVRYFDPSGIFGGVSAALVSQDGRRAAVNAEKLDEEAALVDVEIGYRLLNSQGAISVAVTNLLDQDFTLEDNNFRSVEKRMSAQLPGRAVLLRLRARLETL